MLSEETIIFFIFVIYGLCVSIIYDIFRALRKTQKKTTPKIVLIQDVIYIMIISIMIIGLMYKYIKSDLRVYLMLASILGVVIYYSIFGNSIRKIFEKIISLWQVIFEFLFITMEPYKELFNKHIKKFMKIVKKCCKRNSYMINSKYNIFKSNIINLFKRGVKYWIRKIQQIKIKINLRIKSIK